MIISAKLILHEPKDPIAFEGGRSGAEPSKKTNPLAVPGGQAGKPKAAPAKKQKTPNCGTRSEDHGGLVYGPEKTGGSMIKVSKILAQWVNVESDKVENFETPHEFDEG